MLRKLQEMAESVAEAKYREFESLRKRFGGEQGAEGEKCKQQQQIFRRETACKRRPNDPRANAPPLVPLVEEGDQLEEVCNYGHMASCIAEWERQIWEGLGCRVQWKEAGLRPGWVLFYRFNFYAG